MTPDEAAEGAQAIATQLVDDHLESEPGIGLLTLEGELHFAPASGYDHPRIVLERAAQVEGRTWVGVVVVATGRASDARTGEPLGTCHTVTACFGGEWWDSIVLASTGVQRTTDRPQGEIPDAMHQAVLKRP